MKRNCTLVPCCGTTKRATLKNSLAAHKVKHTLNTQPNNPTPRELPKRDENISLNKDLYTEVYSSFICNS